MGFFTPDIIRKYKFKVKGIAMLLGQCHYETLGFFRLRENLNYNAESLLKTFPKYFSTRTAGTYANNPVKIANIAYANRLGNGSEITGDGWKYRGGGWPMITGRYHYLTCGIAIGLDLINKPELLEDMGNGFKAAIWYFNTFKLINITDCVAVTKALKGVSDETTEEREKLYKKYLGILS